MSVNVPIKMHAGDTKTLVVQVYLNQTDTIAPINGSTIRWVLYKANNVILTKTYPSGIDHIDLNSGKFNVKLFPADTENLEPSIYRHECEVTDSGGNVATVFYGRFILLKSKA